MNDREWEALIQANKDGHLSLGTLDKLKEQFFNGPRRIDYKDNTGKVVINDQVNFLGQEMCFYEDEGRVRSGFERYTTLEAMNEALNDFLEKAKDNAPDFYEDDEDEDDVKQVGNWSTFVYGDEDWNSVLEMEVL